MKFLRILIGIVGEIPYAFPCISILLSLAIQTGNHRPKKMNKYISLSIVVQTRVSNTIKIAVRTRHLYSPFLWQREVAVYLPSHFYLTLCPKRVGCRLDIKSIPLFYISKFHVWIRLQRLKVVVGLL
jgi:hypothetical protein